MCVLPPAPILPDVLRLQVEAQLAPGEKLIWADQPVPELYARGAIGLVLFGAVWTAISVFWEIGAAMSVYKSAHPIGSLALPLFGLPFVLFGLALLTSPMIVRRLALRTVYVVTNQRAIVIKALLFGRVEIQSFPPDRLRSMTRKDRADGSGDLVFEEVWRRVGHNSTVTRLGFMALRNVQDVENLIYKTL
jgi:hypothetical protein